MPNKSIPPYMIRDEILSVLRQTLIKLKSSESLYQLHNASEEQIAQWTRTLIQADEARDKLEKAALSQIRDGLKINSRELRQGVDTMRRTLKGFDKLEPVLDGTKVFLKLISVIMMFI